MIQQPNVRVKLSMFQISKTNPITFYEELPSNKNADADHPYIYTDGSKDGDKDRCPSVRNKLRLMKLLPDIKLLYLVQIGQLSTLPSTS